MGRSRSLSFFKRKMLQWRPEESLSEDYLLSDPLVKVAIMLAINKRHNVLVLKRQVPAKGGTLPKTVVSRHCCTPRDEDIKSGYFPSKGLR